MDCQTTMVIMKLLLILIILEFSLIKMIYSSTSQPWPLTIHKVAGSCCDNYFNYLSHNLSQLIHSYDELLQNNYSNMFPLKTSLREITLFACLVYQANSSRSREAKVDRNDRRIVISTSVYYPLIGHDNANHFNGFKDNNIMRYAHLQFAVMAAYAEHNNYQHIFAPFTYSIEESSAGRVVILISLIDFSL